MDLKACSKDLETIIKEKDSHIRKIEAELNLIKQLLEKAALTVKKKGFR